MSLLHAGYRYIPLETLFKQIIDVLTINRNLGVCFRTVVEEDLEEFLVCVNQGLQVLI
jgi:hypothetical protein